jgi:hypothetical protein
MLGYSVTFEFYTKDRPFQIKMVPALTVEVTEPENDLTPGNCRIGLADGDMMDVAFSRFDCITVLRDRDSTPLYIYNGADQPELAHVSGDDADD